VQHPKWAERPLLVVVRRPGMEVSREDLLDWFAGKVARWWTPDDVVFAESLPVGGTGKIQKNKLREAYAGHCLPTA
jgi:fatty-acyl-CoA synthase